LNISRNYAQVELQLEDKHALLIAGVLRLLSVVCSTCAPHKALLETCYCRSVARCFPRDATLLTTKPTRASHFPHTRSPSLSAGCGATLAAIDVLCQCTSCTSAPAPSLITLHQFVEHGSQSSPAHNNGARQALLAVAAVQQDDQHGTVRQEHKPIAATSINHHVASSHPLDCTALTDTSTRLCYLPLHVSAWATLAWGQAPPTPRATEAWQQQAALRYSPLPDIPVGTPPSGCYPHLAIALQETFAALLQRRAEELGGQKLVGSRVHLFCWAREMKEHKGRNLAWAAADVTAYDPASGTHHVSLPRSAATTLNCMP
jgi:hypothetical protein